MEESGSVQIMTDPDPGGQKTFGYKRLVFWLYPVMFTIFKIAGFPVGVTVRIKLQRASQTYVFPFHLSDEVILQPIFYGKKTHPFCQPAPDPQVRIWIFPSSSKNSKKNLYTYCSATSL